MTRLVLALALSLLAGCATTWSGRYQLADGAWSAKELRDARRQQIATAIHPAHAEDSLDLVALGNAGEDLLNARYPRL